MSKQRKWHRCSPDHKCNP